MLKNQCNTVTKGKATKRVRPVPKSNKDDNNTEEDIEAAEVNDDDSSLSDYSRKT